MCRKKYVRTQKHPFPVQGKGAGDGSLFEICKIIGYRQTLYPQTKFEQKRGNQPQAVYHWGNAAYIINTKCCIASSRRNTCYAWWYTATRMIYTLTRDDIPSLRLGFGTHSVPRGPYWRRANFSIFKGEGAKISPKGRFYSFQTACAAQSVWSAKYGALPRNPT